MHGLGVSSQAEVLPLWTFQRAQIAQGYPKWTQRILAQVFVEEMQNILVEHFYGGKRKPLDRAGESSAP